ncbi:MAG: hypothetical protein ACTSVM_02185 [Candidatus Ranarchaeia archaeon]
MYNDGLLGAVSISNLDEDYKDQVVTAKGRVIQIIDISWPVELEDFVITDHENNSIYVNYDGDLPSLDSYVVVVGVL